MKALTWQGNQHVEVDRGCRTPSSHEPTDAIVRVTSTAICGSDLHLYGVLGPYLTPGDVLGHEAMGIVEEVGSAVGNLRSRRPCGRAVQHLLRPLLDVLARAVRAVRDDAGPRARARAPPCSATPRCTARCPAGRPSTCGSPRPSSVRSWCRDGRPGRAVPVPVRRPADGLAGRRIRRHPRRRHARRPRPRPDRPDGGAHRGATSAPTGSSGRPGARAAGPGRAASAPRP